MGKLDRRAARQLADEGGAAAAVAAGLSPPADGPADPSGSPAKVRGKGVRMNAPVKLKVGDWLCAKPCRNHNMAFRTHCNKCGRASK